jgi:hypothetical protein
VLERRGIPTVVIVTEIFTALAHIEAEAKGMPNVRIVTVDHPLGGNTRQQVEAKAAVAYQGLLPLLGLEP